MPTIKLDRAILKKLINRSLELTKLPTTARVLEIGCGPGTATGEFAQLGFSLVGLEPSASACEIAKQNCAPYPAVEIINTTFEEWKLPANKFNAVLATTSFHWVSPESRYVKTAAALQDNGYLILLWNTAPQPSQEFYQQVLDRVYQTHAPSLTGYEAIASYQKNLRYFGEAIINSGLFEDLKSEQLISHLTYSIDSYLALLSTLSPYIVLESEQRNNLFASLEATLRQNCGTSIDLSYLSLVQIARKR